VQAFENKDYYDQKLAKFEIMKARYNAVKDTLKDEKYNECFSAIPYNSGYFMCVQLVDGIDGEEVRKLLIEKYGIGIINLNNVIRIAYSAVAAKDVKEMFEGIFAACKEVKK
jgi:DNA-binding transcriptional MocR family regulator